MFKEPFATNCLNDHYEEIQEKLTYLYIWEGEQTGSNPSKRAINQDHEECLPYRGRVIHHLYIEVCIQPRCSNHFIGKVTHVIHFHHSIRYEQNSIYS